MRHVDAYHHATLVDSLPSPAAGLLRAVQGVTLRGGVSKFPFVVFASAVVMTAEPQRVPAEVRNFFQEQRIATFTAGRLEGRKAAGAAPERTAPKVLSKEDAQLYGAETFDRVWEVTVEVDWKEAFGDARGQGALHPPEEDGQVPIVINSLNFPVGSILKI